MAPSYARSVPGFHFLRPLAGANTFAPTVDMKRALYHFFFHTLAGWRIKNELTEDPPRYIVVVAPHTSNWDFPIGLATRALLPMGDVKYLAKSSLFKPLYGWLFKAFGGYPVDRSKHNNMVDAVVDLFDRGEIHKIAITPEGTRSYQPNWKTGFHFIARKAKVPVILGTFDYPSRTVILAGPFPLTEDPEADIERMKTWFRQYTGKNPEQGLR
jgi:1-acyl-sn-glycerol-3-phosphate acyltransferase